MTDFHTHILPGIDDGSRNIEMTEQMLRREMEQGVTHVYATPHFYAHRRSVQQFVERRDRALAQTRGLLESEEGFPEITAGAEVYYFRGIGKSEHLRDLCIEGTDIILLEMPFEQWNVGQYRDVLDIINRMHLRIVLAHIERYEPLQKDRSVWDEIISLPLTLQMNAGSFITGLTSGLHARKTAKFCLSTLSDFDNCIIGTDCHNLTDRAPNLASARTVIAKKAGADRLRQLDRYSEELLHV